MKKIKQPRTQFVSPYIKRLYILNTVFFLLFIACIFIPIIGSRLGLAIFAVFIGWFVCGLLLTRAVFKESIKGKVKKYLILVGISPIGVVLSAILHNVVYGLFILFLGSDIWQKLNVEDEPIFFLLATIVFPAFFLVGTIGAAKEIISNKT